MKAVLRGIACGIFGRCRKCYDEGACVNNIQSIVNCCGSFFGAERNLELEYTNLSRLKKFDMIKYIRNPGNSIETDRGEVVDRVKTMMFKLDINKEITNIWPIKIQYAERYQGGAINDGGSEEIEKVFAHPDLLVLAMADRELMSHNLADDQQLVFDLLFRVWWPSRVMEYGDYVHVRVAKALKTVCDRYVGQWAGAVGSRARNQLNRFFQQCKTYRTISQEMEEYQFDGPIQPLGEVTTLDKAGEGIKDFEV